MPLRRQRHLKSVDAPVSGGVGGAMAGTLTFMVGGADDAVALARPILKPMGKKIVHCGDAGAGQAAKICNNMILGISMIGVGEAFVLAEKLGLSHQALFDVASTSSGQCWSLTTYCPVPGPVPTSPGQPRLQARFRRRADAEGSEAVAVGGRRLRRLHPARSPGGGNFHRFRKPRGRGKGFFRYHRVPTRCRGLKWITKPFWWSAATAWRCSRSTVPSNSTR